MKSGYTVKTMVGIALMCVFIILTGWIIVPSVVPFTMQTLGVFLAVGLLGMKSSMLSVAVYLILGGLGLPVFAGMKGGMGVLIGPTGGYLIGFLFTGLIAGLCMGNSKNPWRTALSLAAGLMAGYAFGTLWYVFGYASSAEIGGLWGALTLCVFPYLLPDGIKIFAAVLIIQKVDPLLARGGWKRW